MARPMPSTRPDLQGADQLLVRWRQANDRINSYISVGNYRAATQVALGSAEDDSTPAFDKLEDQLGKAMTQSRSHLRNDVINARSGLSGAQVGRRGAQPGCRHRGRVGPVAAAERVSIMNAPATGPAGEPYLGVLATAIMLAGCGHTESLTTATVPTLPPPTPVGMEQMPAEPPLPPDDASQDCNATASLRPFPNKAEADAAVADIRARGRLIVGLDIGSNLFSFRDPITGEITGFDVDIAGEIARDIFGAPSHVEYRILSSPTSASPRCSSPRSTSSSRP